MRLHWQCAARQNTQTRIYSLSLRMPGSRQVMSSLPPPLPRHRLLPCTPRHRLQRNRAGHHSRRSQRSQMPVQWQLTYLGLVASSGVWGVSAATTTLWQHSKVL